MPAFAWPCGSVKCQRSTPTPGDVATLSASQWNAGGITAGSIKKLTTKANSKLAGADGDVKIDITLTGSASSSVRQTLGKATVAGRLVDALWSIASGDAGSISLGTMESSQIRVGVGPGVVQDELPAAAGDFAAQSSLGGVTIKGIKGQAKSAARLIDSIIAAWELGSVKLGVVQTSNGSAPIGLAADTIKSVAGEVLGGDKLPKLSKLDDPADGFTQDDFAVVLV